MRHYSHGAVRKRSFLTVYAMLELACSTISKYWHQKCQLDVLLDSFRQNVHFRTMGHVTKLMFCHIKHFIAELKCVYKASLIISLHKYVNNSIYVFYPKFRKSRLLCSLNRHTVSAATIVSVLMSQKSTNDCAKTHILPILRFIDISIQIIRQTIPRRNVMCESCGNDEPTLLMSWFVQ